jgi:hypothetical protein
VSDSSAEVETQSLIQVASKASRALATLDADLRAGGFRQNCLGLARELYESFAAECAAARGTEAEPVVWAIGRALAIDLDAAGARQAALALLDGLIAFGASRADPRSVQRLRETEEAIEPTITARRRNVVRVGNAADRPPVAATPPVQDKPTHQPDLAPLPLEPAAVKPDVVEGPASRLQVEPTAPRSEASPQVASVDPDQTSEPEHEALPDPAYAWLPPSPRSQWSDPMPSNVRANPEPAAQGAETETPASVFITPRADEESRDGEVDGQEPMALQESGRPHAIPELSVETGLKIDVDERPILSLADLRPARRPSRRAGKFLLGVAAMLVGAILYLQQSHDPELLRRSLSMVTESVSRLTGALAAKVSSVNTSPANTATTASASLGVASIDAESVEKLPPPGQGLLLSSEEVRYCVFQGRRLGFLRSQIAGNDSIQRFNALAKDFNSRCKSFRFENEALQAADRLANAKQSQLQADAIKILASWVPKDGGPLIDLRSYDGASEVQERLRALGYYHHTVDGVWGPNSAVALSKFRGNTGLGSGSVWDSATQSALLGR